MDTTDGSAQLRSPDRLLRRTVTRGGGWFAADVACQVGGAVVAVLTPAALAAGVDAALGHAPDGAVETLVAVLAVGVVTTVGSELAQPYAATASVTRPDAYWPASPTETTGTTVARRHAWAIAAISSMS